MNQNLQREKYSIHQNECLRDQEKSKSFTKHTDNKRKFTPRHEYNILNILFGCISKTQKNAHVVSLIN